MTDIYIGFTLLSVTFASAIVYAVFKRWFGNSQPTAPDTAYSAHNDYRYNPATSILETNAGFTGGAVIGAALNAQHARKVHHSLAQHNSSVVQPIITKTTIVEDDPAVSVITPLIIALAAEDIYQSVQSVPVVQQPETFTGFSGGDSDGGGATSSWDTSDSGSCDTSSSSYDTGSSSSDCSSSDSSSSSSDF